MTNAQAIAQVNYIANEIMPVAGIVFFTLVIGVIFIAFMNSRR